MHLLILDLRVNSLSEADAKSVTNTDLLQLVKFTITSVTLELT